MFPILTDVVVLILQLEKLSLNIFILIKFYDLFIQEFLLSLDSLNLFHKFFFHQCQDLEVFWF